MNCYDLGVVQLFGALVDLYAALIGKAVAFIRKSLSPSVILTSPLGSLSILTQFQVSD